MPTQTIQVHKSLLQAYWGSENKEASTGNVHEEELHENEVESSKGQHAEPLGHWDEMVLILRS